MMFKITFDAVDSLVISMPKLPEEKRVNVYHNIAAFASECREIAERLNRPVAVIEENLSNLLHSCRCLARLEEDGHPDASHVTWALIAIKALRSYHGFAINAESSGNIQTEEK